LEWKSSPREQEALKLLADGRTNKEIGKKLNIAEETVKKHVQTIIAKLGASDRTQAAVKAIRFGLAK
jgi:DNA-binding NarL/FixJ family response regulator